MGHGYLTIFWSVSFFRVFIVFSEVAERTVDALDVDGTCSRLFLAEMKHLCTTFSIVQLPSKLLPLNLHFRVGPFVIINVYRPPSALSDRLFTVEFQKFFNSLNLDRKDLLMVGDFNSPQNDWVDRRATSFRTCQADFLEFCFFSSLRQVVEKPMCGSKT